MNRRPTTAKLLATQVKRVAKVRRKPEVVFFYVVFCLVVVLALLEILEKAKPKTDVTALGPDVNTAKPSIGTRITDVARPLSDPSEKKEPQLLIFLQRIRNALRPFMQKYIQEVETPDLAPLDAKTCGPFWSSRRDGWTLPPCADDCAFYETLKVAKAKCIALGGDSCGGVTQVKDGRFQIRPWGNGMSRSTRGERSWKFIDDICKDNTKIQRSTAPKVWDAFHDIVDASLDDESLHLMSGLYKTKEDGSIFVSIASYRDHTCTDTLRKAFTRAANPDKISAGIVQQNCQHPTKCMTGTGWANTRQWVRSPGPDPDCATDFCESDFGKRHCEAGRVRILRLDEIDSLGPFFTRFVNSKLWRGENFYLQIDAHTDFRQDWDISMVAQMRATNSYPMSVISNYPPGGTPSDDSKWPALSHPTTPDDKSVPSALCGCTFETAGASHMTVRLAYTGRTFSKNLERPRRSLFVAAGFFIAHGSIVNNVGFDPFLPFLFMGEEIALSIRFYTNGYDIYAPSAEVLRHEYVRKESPKFWESVGHVYSAANLHNELSDLIVQRVQNLVRFPEADAPDKISPQSLLTKLDEYGLGTVRTADRFNAVAGMDLVRKKQSVPRWCIEGGDPKDEVKIPSSSKLDMDLIH